MDADILRCPRVLRRWTGGRYGVGSRIKLRYTRAIINAIHSGELTRAETVTTPIFSLHVRHLPGTASMKLWLHTPSHDIFLEASGQSFVQHTFSSFPGG